MCVAPSRRATSSREASCVVPATIKFLAPAMRAISVQSKPIGPGPITTTVSPGRTVLFEATALYATQQGSVSAARSNGSSSGMWCRQRAGTHTKLAIAPSVPAPKPERLGQRLYLPVRHSRHSPQMFAAVSETTRSPSRNPLTRAPTSATVPQNSCPSTTGTRTGQLWELWYWWMSLPQTPTAPTCRSTSSSFIAGTGFWRNSTARGSRA